MAADFWDGRRVLVAGGAGFIGSYLVRLLVDAGARVRVADNLERGRKENLTSVWDRIEFLQLDLASMPNCMTATDGMDVAMNLAARACGLEYSQSHHGEMLTSNTVLGFNLLEAARRNQVDRFLVVSTSCVYADDARNPIPESAFVGVPEKANEGYGYGKINLEQQARFYAREYGMKIAIARPNNAYGNGDAWDGPKAHVIPSLIKRVLDEEDPVVVWGSGQQTRAFVHARDIATAFMLLVERHAVGEPVNVGHESGTSIADLVQMICRLAGKSPRIVFDRSKPEGAPCKSLSSARLRQVTGGFVPATALDQGLREMVSWYRANYVEATTRSAPLLSIVTPVYCEDELIVSTITEVKEKVQVPYEMIVVYDFDEDTTLPYVREMIPDVPELRLLKNTKGRGALNAVKSGLEAARGEFVVIVNGDLSDDMSTVHDMIRMMRDGCDVACGTRYSMGGRKEGGPFVQDLLSRIANATFSWLAHFPTRDATNSFKMYRASFLRDVTIESNGGFEFSFELALKAKARGLKVSEVPTVWKQRKAGESRFRVLAWSRYYMKWYWLGIMNAWFRLPVESPGVSSPPSVMPS
jgi:nucleoside-diphosphate-sugar epimerase